MDEATNIAHNVEVIFYAPSQPYVTDLRRKPTLSKECRNWDKHMQTNEGGRAKCVGAYNTAILERMNAMYIFRSIRGTVDVGTKLRYLLGFVTGSFGLTSHRV
jgi:hypothetical protein